MKRNLIFGAMLALVCASTCLAQDSGYWRVASNPAKVITGDIAISRLRLTINFDTFPMVQARALKPEEVAAVFDADVNGTIFGTLYRVTIPARHRFLHHNTLCGDEDTEWMATYASGRSLQVAFFSGQDPPVFTMDSISHSTSLCGTFIYGR